MSQFIIVDMDNINQILTEHINRIDNPHRVKPADIELGNVDNTSDMDKPVSKATQELIDKNNKNTLAIITDLHNDIIELRNKLDPSKGFTIINLNVDVSKEISNTNISFISNEDIKLTKNSNILINFIDLLNYKEQLALNKSNKTVINDIIVNGISYQFNEITTLQSLNNLFDSYEKDETPYTYLITKEKNSNVIFADFVKSKNDLWNWVDLETISPEDAGVKKIKVSDLELENNLTVNGSTNLQNTKLGTFDSKGEPIFDYQYYESGVQYPDGTYTTSAAPQNSSLHGKLVINKNVTKEDLKFLTTCYDTTETKSWESFYGYGYFICQMFVQISLGTILNSNEDRYGWTDSYLCYNPKNDTASWICDRYINDKRSIYKILEYSNIASETKDLNINFYSPTKDGIQWEEDDVKNIAYVPMPHEDIISKTPIYTRSFETSTSTYYHKSTLNKSDLNKLFYLTVLEKTESQADRASLAITGTATFYNDVNFYTRTNFNHSNVKNIQKLEAQTANFTGDVKAGALDINGMSNFYGPLRGQRAEFESTLSTEGELDVTGTSSLHGDVKIDKSLTVTKTARTQGDLITKKIKPLDNASYDIGNNTKYYKKIYLSTGIKTYGTVSEEGIPTDEFLLELPKKNGTLATLDDIGGGKEVAALKEQVGYLKTYLNQLAGYHNIVIPVAEIDGIIDNNVLTGTLDDGTTIPLEYSEN